MPWMPWREDEVDVGKSFDRLDKEDDYDYDDDDDDPAINIYVWWDEWERKTTSAGQARVSVSAMREMKREMERERERARGRKGERAEVYIVVK